MFNRILAAIITLFHGSLYWSEGTSSAIARFGYNAKDRTLDVHFVRARTLYRYTGVPVSAVWKLMVAESVGSAFNEWIRDEYPVVDATWRPKSVRKASANRAMMKSVEGSSRQKGKLIRKLNAIIGRGPPQTARGN